MTFQSRLALVLESYGQLELCPQLWDGEELRSNIRSALLEVADDFAEQFDISEDALVDVVLTGSLANYNWTPLSDIDLHLIVDFTVINPDVDLVREYYRLAKSIWNNDHAVEICKHEIEIYVQDMAEVHYSSGVYSLQDEDWLVMPKKDGIRPDRRVVDAKVESYISKIDNIADKVQAEEPDAFQLAERLRDKIKKMRRTGLSQSGEYSTENLVFKKLRSKGYLDKLADLHMRAYDLRMSIQQCPTTR